jgi:hypothetical protein
MLRYEVLFLIPTNLIGIKIFFNIQSIIRGDYSITDAYIKAVQECDARNDAMEDCSPKHNYFSIYIAIKKPLAFYFLLTYLLIFVDNCCNAARS